MKIQTVILGSDVNAYGMARSFHMAFSVKSILLSKAKLLMSDNSSIVDFCIDKNLDSDEIMIKRLIEISNKFDYKPILIASSDSYAMRVIKNRDKLLNYYHLPFTNESLMNKLIYKKDFYELCEKYSLSYPKSVYINRANYGSFNLDIEFPVVLKPSNSIKFTEIEFEGKKKAFIIKNIDELNSVLSKIYNTYYDDYMIIQEFIEGPDSNMYVLNAYADRQSNVTLMSLGHCIMEDPTPLLIGNYLAICEADKKAERIYPMIKSFLEKIEYTGLCNFDFKYDEKNDSYKVFEINLRQGRSSFFSTLSGANPAFALYNDFIKNEEVELRSSKDFLWLGANYKTVEKYIEDEEAKKIFLSHKEDIYSMTLYYQNDENKKRFNKIKDYYDKYDERFKLFFEKKCKE